MDDLSDVTVGIKTFYRPEKIKNALKSLVGLEIKRVIVADDGKIDEKKEKIYEEMSQLLPLEVLRLPYNSGVAYGRNMIIKRTRTPYLLMLDDDMEVMGNINILRKILEENDCLGGVAAILIEKGQIRTSAQNLKLKEGYLIRYVPQKVEVHYASDIPYMLFDFIPNATLFRVKCFKDYRWDVHYKMFFEHVDFFWGHKKAEKWRFAITPSVFFKHNPGGDKEYLAHRYSREKYKASRDYFLKKWGLKGIISLSPGLMWLIDYTSILDFINYWIKKRLPFNLLKLYAKIEEKITLPKIRG